MKVSVLVPIYKVEKYIARCARSLFCQTMKEGIEFIFTDDASPDRSIDILLETLEEFPERKHQVKILRHESNRGLAATRKTGFLASRGEYIIHCDSDDWVEPDMYETMYQEAKKIDADFVCCNYFFNTDSSQSEQKLNFNFPTHIQISRVLNSTPPVCMVWLRLFRSSFYRTFGLTVPDVNRYEDNPISLIAHYEAKKIGHIDRPLYHYYRSNAHSIMATESEDKIRDGILVADYIYNYLSKRNDRKEVLTIISPFLLKTKHIFIWDSRYFNPAKWREMWPEISIWRSKTKRGIILMLLARMKCDKILKLFLK